MNNYLFFDSASTTKCCEAAIELIQKYSSVDFGNPSSNHIYGQKAARAIKDARAFFAQSFKVEPNQVIFTGSGSEADNFAIYGVVTEKLAQKNRPNPIRVLSSAIEHPAVRRTVESLSPLGIEVDFLPVDSNSQIIDESYVELLKKSPSLVSIQQVNNILGSILPVEALAKKAKEYNPEIIFHTDSVQAFGKIKVPHAPSSVDLVSISAHKMGGPKGMGALIILNKKLLQRGLRPLIWGGEQENGFRSGTQNAGLIAGFHAAAKVALQDLKKNLENVSGLIDYFRELLVKRGLLELNDLGKEKSTLRWNSPLDSVPHIISLSAPGFPAGPLAKLLEERKCLVSVGSACSSRKSEPDPVLSAIGLPMEIQTSTIRVSFSPATQMQEIEILVQALDESISVMKNLMGKSASRRKVL